MTTIDPENPPAMTILLIGDGETRPWYGTTTLRDQRLEVPGAMARHMKDPEYMSRPMCIVRLKAWK